MLVHAHYVAKEDEGDRDLPDGTVKPLIWIQDWDFNWQDLYTYKSLVTLPRGTRIDVRVTSMIIRRTTRKSQQPAEARVVGRADVR